MKIYWEFFKNCWVELIIFFFIIGNTDSFKAPLAFVFVVIMAYLIGYVKYISGLIKILNYLNEYRLIALCRKMKITQDELDIVMDSLKEERKISLEDMVKEFKKIID